MQGRHRLVGSGAVLAQLKCQELIESVQAVFDAWKRHWHLVSQPVQKDILLFYGEGSIRPYLIYGNYFYILQEVTTKHRFRNNKYRLEVRERDHLPMHVHLVGGGFNVLIDLTTLQSIGAWPRGLKIEVMAWISANLDELMKDWKKWHP